MTRHRLMPLAALCLALVAARPASAADGQLLVTVDHPARIFYRLHDGADYLPVSQEPVQQASFTVDRTLRYDVRAEGRADFFHTWVAEKQDVVSGPNPISLDTQAALDWTRVGLLAGGALLTLAGAAVTQSRRRMQKAEQQQRALAEQLSESQARAGLFPADGSMPSHIGPYRVLQRLGAGGMALVYGVESPAGDVLALKLPLPHVWDDPEFKKRFGRELSIARQLTHPNLVRIVDINDGLGDFPYPFLVMEWVKGQALNHCLKRGLCQSQDNVLAVGLSVLDALEATHRRQIVHRDIKPGNIMVTTDGRIKLMDFGVARQSDATRLTGTEEMLGTPLYMAPEQIECGPIDARTDLYALGCVLYEMAAGGPPFTEPNALKLTVVKLKDDPRPVCARNPQVDPLLDACIMNLIARRPEARYQSTAEARTALAALVGDAPRFTVHEAEDTAPTVSVR